MVWRKSSHSGPDDGNDCVEIANSITQIGVRDSKLPSRAVLTFPTSAFMAFITEVKRTERSSNPSAR
ncbi:DUF397 domain-containing protein [Streptomyces ziwulingensis]